MVKRKKLIEYKDTLKEVIDDAEVKRIISSKERYIHIKNAIILKNTLGYA